MNRQEYIESMRDYGFQESTIKEYLEIADEMRGDKDIDYEPFIPPFIDEENHRFAEH